MFPTHLASKAAAPIQEAATFFPTESTGMDSTDKGKPPAAASGVIRRATAIAFEFGKSQLRNIPIFRIQQRRRRIPLATPLQIFPVLSHIPITSTCLRRKDGRPR